MSLRTKASSISEDQIPDPATPARLLKGPGDESKEFWRLPKTAERTVEGDTL